MKQDIMRELDQRLATLNPKSPMSLNQNALPQKPPPRQNQNIAWQQAPQSLAGGQVIGTPMSAQGVLQGQQVLLVPVQIPH